MILKKLGCAGLVLCLLLGAFWIFPALCVERGLRDNTGRAWGSAHSQLTLQPFPPALLVSGIMEFSASQHGIHGLAQSCEIIARGLSLVLFLEQNPFVSVKILSEDLEFPSRIRVLALHAI